MKNAFDKQMFFEIKTVLLLLLCVQNWNVTSSFKLGKQAV